MEMKSPLNHAVRVNNKSRMHFFNGCVGGLLYQCFGLIVFIN